jgi:hypothetical protein
VERLRAATGRSLSHSPQRRVKEDSESPRGRTHLALAGVAGVWWSQFRPQQAFCAVTQCLCESKKPTHEETKRAGGRDYHPAVSPEFLGPRHTQVPSTLTPERISPLSLWFGKENVRLFKGTLLGY